MQQLIVQFLKEINSDSALNQISSHLDALEQHSLGFSPWHEYPYKPVVQFSIAYTNNSIVLKYYVTEKFIRAAATKTNDAVWEDSCVEFFIAFDSEGYYNLEFNCIGTALVGFGKDKNHRELLSVDTIQKIASESKISKKNNAVYWELTVIIPFTVFACHHITSLKGKTCKANFFKCGDALPEPHYLAWSDIASPVPNFHLPQFFGTVYFA